MAVMDAVAKADAAHAPVFAGRPGQHRHRVGVVQKQAIRGRDLADIPAKTEHRRNPALRVHEPAGTERIAHALIDAVL